VLFLCALLILLGISFQIGYGEGKKAVTWDLMLKYCSQNDSNTTGKFLCNSFCAAKQYADTQCATEDPITGKIGIKSDCLPKALS